MFGDKDRNGTDKASDQGHTEISELLKTHGAKE